jgi:Family of unknown function (DUF6335)
MAKRRAAGRRKAAGSRKKRAPAPRSSKRAATRASSSRHVRKTKKGKARPKKAKIARPRRKAAAPRPTAAVHRAVRKKPHLDRVRRTLDDTVPTPPSSLNMDRRGSAVRTGRAELQDSLEEQAPMTPALTGGDIDANWQNAYFSGDEAPGGDNPTPDQEVVDDIGKSLGVEYQDNEELRGSEKVVDRDRHRWELDPASSEDYKDRK